MNDFGYHARKENKSPQFLKKVKNGIFELIYWYAIACQGNEIEGMVKIKSL